MTTKIKTTIQVIDDASSLVQARADAHEQWLASANLKREARQRLSDRLKPELSGILAHELEEGKPHTRQKVEHLAQTVLAAMQQRGLAGHGPVLPDADAASLLQYMLDWQFGVGPLQPLFREADVEDIVINSVLRPAAAAQAIGLEVWTYRQSGKRREAIELTADELRDLINREAAPQGRALNPTTPILNVQMRSGARLNAVLDPVCAPYISATIRIHRLVARSFNDLIQHGTLTVSAASWLWLCVQSGLATVVAGGTSSGKTNFLNALARVMPEHLRVVVIEDTRELDLAVSDKVYLTTVQHPDPARQVNQRDLVRNALRMRPDRIVLGEVRDGAVWDAVKACNTGHEGTLLTLHAEDAESVSLRLAQLCSEAPETRNLSEKTLREIIASAFQCVVMLERRRNPDGSYQRLVTQINEVNGFISDGMAQQKPLFRLVDGQLKWTRQWPHDRLKRRILDAGFSEKDIQDALEGRTRLWETQG